MPRPDRPHLDLLTLAQFDEPLKLDRSAVQTIGMPCNHRLCFASL
ncbi:Uncharacterised protein [Mycobacteroides abscessus subsp. massiliense]|nr:Uncharacterised protein [Mycobacteroides abscessus subsp. massiliense]